MLAHLPRLALIVALSFGSIVATCSPTRAGTMELAWDEVSHLDLDGYRVFYGLQSGDYTASVDVDVAQSTLGGLDDCTDYHVAVKSRSVDGSLSEDYSSEISGWARPEVHAVQPATLQAGTRIDLILDGINFRPGAVVLLDHPGVTVNGVTLTGCTRLAADVSIATGAAGGDVPIEVLGPDQVYGTAAGLLTVSGDQTAPTIGNVQAQSVSATTATIVWTTDEAATSEVLFRPSGHSVDQPVVSDSALTTQHAVQLSGLAPDTTYSFRVGSADGSGNAAPRSAAQTFTTTSSPFTFVRIEAESGQMTTPLGAVAGAGVFAGSWISTPAGTPNGSSGQPAGSSDYSFHLPGAGTWYFWYRTYAPDAGSESWYVGVDGGGLITLRVGSIASWVWVEGRSQVLGAGLHDLRVGGRRAQTRLDRVLITDDPAFRPSEAPDADRTPPARVSGLSGVSQDGAAALSWSHPGNSDLDRVVVRYRDDGVAPQGPYDGSPLYDAPASPGGTGQLVHTGLSNGTAIRYAVFAIDRRDNASAAARVTVTPHATVELPPQVQNVRREDVR